MLPKNCEDVVYRAVDAGFLRIDDAGRVWRWTNRGMKRAEKLSGQYQQVRRMFAKRRYNALAHRLVWRHFNGPIPEGLTINHKDGNKLNNHPDNLELATYSEQATHARRVLGKCRQDGARNNAAKLTEEAVAEIRRRRKSGEPLKAIAADFSVSDRTVSKIARGDRWAESTG